MAHIFVGIGSNFNREENIIASIALLKKAFGTLKLSNVFESEAIGFNGKNFYNLVVAFHSDLSIEVLINKLKQIELSLGRHKKKTMVQVTIIDLDLLLYGQIIDKAHNIPRAEITKNAFVLKPLTEIAHNLKHPILGVSYEDLWLKYPLGKQNLRKVALAIVN